MKTLDEMLGALPIGDKKYYCSEVATLSDEQKSQLEHLANLLSNAGANPAITWAYSEISEDIPQFGRFLLLKNLFDIIKDTNGIIVEAASFDDNINNKINVLTEVLGEEFLNKFLYAYGKAIISGVISILDGGNYNIKNDGVSWHIAETDYNNEPTGRIIQGLHEDFYDFDEQNQ